MCVFARNSEAKLGPLADFRQLKRKAASTATCDVPRATCDVLQTETPLFTSPPFGTTMMPLRMQ